MFYRLLFTLCLVSVSNIAISACISSVNKSKPSAITGGQFNNCTLVEDEKFCLPQQGNENYMSRHHIFDKSAWINVLNAGLNNGGEASTQMKNHVVAMLKEVGASDVVLQDLDNDGIACSSSTNSWLTWLPVNLSLGPAPQDRSFDPSNDFDDWALYIVPDEYQYIFEDIRTAVSNYENNKIAESFVNLPVVASPWPMLLGDESNWVRAYDERGLVKYCPAIVYVDNPGSLCPNSTVVDSYLSYLNVV